MRLNIFKNVDYSQQGFRGCETITCNNANDYIYLFFVHNYGNTVPIGSAGVYINVYSLFDATSHEFDCPTGAKLLKSLMRSWIMLLYG
jgi:hypothetical protein